MARTREDMLADLRANPKVAALVVGGGINGISAFRELALQGVDVLLVDRGDFCGACSSAPSRMIHGDLRYLENGELGLVRESLRERDALLRNAPHLVRPLPTTVPIQHRFSGLLNGAFGVIGLRSAPAERGALAVKIGLGFYDRLSRHRRAMPRHVFRGRAETARLWPDLPPSVRYSATYYDAWISYPERLGIELIRDGLDAHPAALAINHLEASGREGGRILLTDALTGTTLAVTADVILNATGAWVDETNATLAQGGIPPEPLVGGTKGSHLILDHPELLRALGGHMIYFENVDGRVCILFPYLGRVLLGSTDIRVERPGRVRCEDEEVAYILKSLSYVFPGIPVAPEQIVYRYSGVRPLLRSDASFTGRISRDHFVEEIGGAPPSLCLVGGKWTTFRAFGAKAADRALAILGRRRINDTEERRIGGGAGFPTDEAGRRRRSGHVPALVLVLRPPGSLHLDLAGLRHGQSDRLYVLQKAGVRLSRHGLRHGIDRRHRFRRLGPPHVHGRHGPRFGSVLYCRNHGHRRADRHQDIQLDRHHVGRIDQLLRATLDVSRRAVRDEALHAPPGLDADVPAAVRRGLLGHDQYHYSCISLGAPHGSVGADSPLPPDPECDLGDVAAAQVRDRHHRDLHPGLRVHLESDPVQSCLSRRRQDTARVHDDVRRRRPEAAWSGRELDLLR
jgi:glycerol-3-phosphate dehydrogenase